MVRIISRVEAGLRPAQVGLHTVAATGRTAYVSHHDGKVAIASLSLEQAIAHWRRTQTQHMDKQGWLDVGYNYGIGMGGDVLEGRGLNMVGAHCPGLNLTGWGVQFMKGQDQPLTDLAKAAACDLYAYLMAQAGHELRKLGHRDGFATACPGDAVEAWVKAGMPRPKTSPTPAPIAHKPVVKIAALPAGKPAPAPWRPFPLPVGWYFGPASGPKQSVSGAYSHGQDVKDLQSQLSRRGWKIAVDGVVGDKTIRCFRQFEADQGLLIDGRGDRLLWKAAFESPIR